MESKENSTELINLKTEDNRLGSSDTNSDTVNAINNGAKELTDKNLVRNENINAPTEPRKVKFMEPTPPPRESPPNNEPPQCRDPPPQPQPKQKRYAYTRCLLRMGGDDNLRHIFLETGVDYWVGRLASNNIHLDDPSLSRKHAEMKANQAGVWTVSDNKSANGTYVTPRHGAKRRLDAMTAHVLADLDLVQFGVEKPGTDEAPFRWRFHKALKFVENSSLPRNSLVNCDGTPLSNATPGSLKRAFEDESETDAGPSTSGAKRSRLSNGLDEQLTQYRRQLEEMQAELKRKEEEKERVKKDVETEAKSKMEAAQEEMVRQIDEEKKRFADELKGQLEEEMRSKEEDHKAEMDAVRRRVEEEKKRLEEEMNNAANLESANEQRLRETLEEKEAAMAAELAAAAEKMALEKAALEEKIRAEVEEKVNSLKAEAEREREAMEEEKRKSEKAVEKDLKEKERMMKEEMEKRMTEVEEEKKRLEEDYREALKSEVEATEAALKDQLDREKLALEDEKERIEASIIKQMESKMEEKDKALKDELIKQKAKLDQELATRDAKEKLLQEELEKTKNIQADAELKSAQSVLADLEETMEMELQCAICSELFIDATTLNCCHSFCEYCIAEWKKRKNDCPNCRKNITSMIKSIVLDSYINKMTEHLSQDMKDRRKTMIAERKEELQQAEAAAKAIADAQAAAARARAEAAERARAEAAERARAAAAARANAPRGNNRGNRGNRGGNRGGRNNNQASSSNHRPQAPQQQQPPRHNQSNYIDLTRYGGVGGVIMPPPQYNTRLSPYEEPEPPSSRRRNANNSRRY